MISYQFLESSAV